MHACGDTAFSQYPPSNPEPKGKLRHRPYTSSAARPSIATQQEAHPLYRLRRINHLVGNNLHSQSHIPRTVDTFWNSKAVIV
jgi:hypothetical protein